MQRSCTHGASEVLSLVARGRTAGCRALAPAVPRPPRADACRAGAQAVTFLVIHQKHKKSLEEITNDLCPVLSVQQLYRISTMYWDDRYGTETVSHEACP